jgi:hypothetical protein
MKQISKKDLINLIAESKVQADEFALAGQEWDPTHPTKYRFQPGAKQGDPVVVNPDFKPKKPKPGEAEPKAKKAKPFWTHLPDLTTNQNKVDVWLADPDLTNDKNQKTAIVFTHGVPVDEWKNTNKEYINTIILPEVGGNEQQIRYFLDNKKLDFPDNPKQLQRYLGREDFYDGRELSERELILRSLQGAARKILEVPTHDFLIKNGFPPIELPKQITGDQKASINSRTGVFTNKKIDWKWHKVRNYDNFEEFIGDLNKMVDNGGEGIQAKIKNLIGQFRRGRTSNRGSFVGDEIVTRNDMHIEGAVTNDGGFEWKITFSAHVGQGQSNEDEPTIGLVMVAPKFEKDEATGKMKLLPHVVTTNSRTSQPVKGSVLNNNDVHDALVDALTQVANIVQENLNVGNLISSAYMAVKGAYEAFDDDPENTMAQPQLQPQDADVATPNPEVGGKQRKAVKKITKEDIEAMVLNVIKESIK